MILGYQYISVIVYSRLYDKNLDVLISLFNGISNIVG